MQEADDNSFILNRSLNRETGVRRTKLEAEAMGGEAPGEQVGLKGRKEQECSGDRKGTARQGGPQPAWSGVWKPREG